jgi:hypothetical protein
MSKFKVLIIGGITVGVLAGGTIALFTSGKKQPSTPASTPTAADKAAELNEKGKLLMFDGKYGEAEPLFVEAVRLVPEPKYLFKPGNDSVPAGKVRRSDLGARKGTRQQANRRPAREDGEADLQGLCRVQGAANRVYRHEMSARCRGSADLRALNEATNGDCSWISELRREA